MSPIVDPERRRESGRNAARRYAATPHGREKIRQYRRRRIEAVQAIKIECGCIDCGYREHPAALHFDHRDPDTKQFQVMKAIAAGRAWDDVMAEIAKCDVRCANCHAIRSCDNGHVGRPRIHEAAA